MSGRGAIQVGWVTYDVFTLRVKDYTGTARPPRRIGSRSGRIDISFADKRLERDCEAANIDRRYGVLAEPLRRRLTVLHAATALSDLAGVPGRPEALTSNRRGQFSMRITANKRLIFEVADEPPPLMEDGGIDRTRVRSIRIMEVVDYHER